MSKPRGVSGDASRELTQIYVVINHTLERYFLRWTSQVRPIITSSPSKKTQSTLNHFFSPTISLTPVTFSFPHVNTSSQTNPASQPTSRTHLTNTSTHDAASSLSRKRPAQNIANHQQSTRPSKKQKPQVDWKVLFRRASQIQATLTQQDFEFLTLWYQTISSSNPDDLDDKTISQHQTRWFNLGHEKTIQTILCNIK